MKKIRRTKQKELILSEIESLNAFFTAEELFARLRKKDPKLGIATIYRFLHNLKTKNQLHSYLCNRKAVYSKEESSHCHFVCQKCKKTTHLSIDSLDFLKNKIRGSVCHFQIDISGLCEDCSKN